MSLTALLLAGCGGSSGPNRDEQFVARANAICASAQNKARPLVSAENKLDPRYLGQIVALLTNTGEELQSVTPPPQLRAGYARFLAHARHEVAVIAQLARDVRNRDVAAIRSLQGQLNGRATNEQAEALGLRVCAQEIG